MLKVYQRYAPNALAPTTAYPLGSIKNDSVPGADDGTPIEKDWGNNIEGFHQALMLDAALTATGTPDTAISSQLLEALKIVAANVVKAQMRDVFYPVGAYYFNDTNPINPITLLGFGTWVRVEGRALFGCTGTGIGTFGVTGVQDGSDSHAHTAEGTALSLSQIPSHSHGVRVNGTPGPQYSTVVAGDTSSYDEITQTESAGFGLPHTHGIQPATSLPPYRVVYIWRRIA